MTATLESGKEVRGVNGGRGLERAAYDFNSGDLGHRSNPYHLHVYLGCGPFTFICSAQQLTVDEIGEADKALAKAKDDRANEVEKLRAELIGPNGDAIIAKRQNGNSDQETASRDIVQAVLPHLPIHSNEGSWADVKQAIGLLRLAVEV